MTKFKEINSTYPCSYVLTQYVLCTYLFTRYQIMEMNKTQARASMTNPKDINLRKEVQIRCMGKKYKEENDKLPLGNSRKTS